MDGPLPRPAALDPAAGPFVTIAAFSQPIEAHLARASLEREGIPCRILDEHIVSVVWIWSSAVGGVKLQVPATLHAAAKALLPAGGGLEARPSSDWVSADLAARRCPFCGSLRVQEERIHRGVAFLSWILFGFPIPYFRRRLACGSCGRILARGRHAGP